MAIPTVKALIDELGRYPADAPVRLAVPDERWGKTLKPATVIDADGTIILVPEGLHV